MSDPIERGPWNVGIEGVSVFLQSEDFEHDVRLYVNGDFIDLAQKIKYAELICLRLNSAEPKP
jgi:hypothetical protein